MKYQVFENDKPADCHNYALHHSWHTSKFDTLEEAIAYLIKYFHPFIGKWDNGIGKIEYYEDCTAEIRVVD